MLEQKILMGGSFDKDEVILPSKIKRFITDYILKYGGGYVT